MSERRHGFPDPADCPPFRIEDCLVLPALNRIECRDDTQQVEPRIMQVLVCLASRPGRVISRQVLFEAVWADSVVCEEALTRTITELRRVFHDDTRAPRVIETIRKGGYRLIAPVRPAAEPEHIPLPAGEAPAERRWPGVGLVRGRRPGMAGMSIAGVAALALLALLAWGSRVLTPIVRGGDERLESRPLTSSPGVEAFPAVSPDGRMVAFAASGASGDGASDVPQLDLYVMTLRNGPPVRLTDTPGFEGFPAWSPDGTEIAFVSETAAGNDICIVPFMGGTVRRMASIRGLVNGLAWSPDGRGIAYSAGDSLDAIPRIRLLSVADLVTRELTSPAHDTRGDIEPSFSPGGRSVAFTRVGELGERELRIVATAGGEPRRIDIGGDRIFGMGWRSDDELIVSAGTDAGNDVWRVAADGRMRVRLPFFGGPLQRLSIARGATQVVGERLSYQRDIGCFDVDEAGTLHPRSAPLIASTRSDSDPAFSPDGRSVAFISERSGSQELWVADRDGLHPRQLTDGVTGRLTAPRWSPDGARIAYTRTDGEASTIRVTDVASRTTRTLLQDGRYILAAWSRHGGDLYYVAEARRVSSRSSGSRPARFAADSTTGWEVWRMHPDGSGRRRICEGSVSVVGETPDGKGLFCLKPGEQGLWMLPVEGGAPSPDLSGAVCRGWQDLTITPEGVFFIRRDSGTPYLGFYDRATARADSLAPISFYAGPPSVSPDGTMLLHDRVSRIESDLVVIDMGESSD